MHRTKQCQQIKTFYFRVQKAIPQKFTVPVIPCMEKIHLCKFNQKLSRAGTQWLSVKVKIFFSPYGVGGLRNFNFSHKSKKIVRM